MDLAQVEIVNEHTFAQFSLNIAVCWSYRFDKIRMDSIDSTLTDSTWIVDKVDRLSSGHSDTKEICVFRFLDNDYKASSSKPWLCIFSFRFSLSRNNCRLFNCIFLYFCTWKPAYSIKSWEQVSLGNIRNGVLPRDPHKPCFQIFNPFDSDYPKRMAPIEQIKMCTRWLSLGSWPKMIFYFWTNEGNTLEFFINTM